MPSLTADEIEQLRITHFIFHVVHHGQPEPILLDAVPIGLGSVPIGDFERFFLGRVSDTLKGNRFDFTAGSLTRDNLAAIASAPGRFVDVSQTLARQFHSHDDLRIKRGVLIVMVLRTGTRRLYSLIKYDHEKVVAFDVQDTTAILTDVVNSFTESPAALQKSALIELMQQGGELAIIDRNTRTGISGFFERFLGVTRRHSETEMTKGIVDATLKTVQRHRLELPSDITTRVKPKILEITQNRTSFDAEQFVGDFFGAHGSDAIRATFQGELERRNLAGEAFTYDRSAVPAAGPRKYVTNEGIRLVVPESALGTFSQTTDSDGWTTVTIRTRQVTEQ
ncbi:nucleoid-associated protein [Rhizobium sp. BK060]|uniref:nucleoid-associated protein n=1 Tax=Rhizobium sp. BK060 TaxID=2587096 RepID=UPI00160C0766|nr:nucleoid-associated protein [Rhizobium sp. BK060]MBB3396119.1 hypothetical protein [Rhizobium sp. BK060]